MRDSRSTLDAGTALTGTAGARELMDAQVPEPTVRVALWRRYGVSTKITKYGAAGQSREDLAKVSPVIVDRMAGDL